MDLTYSPQVQPEPLPGRAYPHLPGEVPAGAFGGEIGAGFEHAGAVVEQVKRQADQTQLTDAHNQLQAISLATTHDPQNGFFTLQGKNAIGAGPQYLAKFDEQAQDVLSKIPSPRARQAAQLAAAQVRNHLSEQIDSHTLQQMREYSATTAKSSVALAQQTAAANYNHPDILATNLDHVDASIEDLAHQQGWSQEQLDETRHVEHMKFHEGVLTSMLADKKPALARAYLDHVKGELKPQEIKTATTAIEAGEVDAAVQPIMAAYSQDTTLGAQQLTHLPPGLSQDQQFRVVQEVDRQRRDLEAQRRQDPQNQRALMALERSIATGKPINGADGMIDSLWRKGAISDDQRISLTGHVARVNDAAADDAAVSRAYRDAYTNRTPLPPDDPKAKKGIDLLFQGMTANSKPGSPEWGNRAIDIGERTGIFPNSAVKWTTAALTSGDPDSAAAAADLQARMRETNPRAAAFAIDEKTQVLGDSIRAGVRAGGDPEKIVEMVRKNGERTDLDVLKEQWQNQKVTQGQPNALRARLSADSGVRAHFWQGTPDVPPAMQADFDHLTRQYFDYTGGNLSQARDSAAATIRNVWGVSEVNGKRQFMPYAPEHMFPGLTPDAIHEDISNTLKGDERTSGIDATKVQLAPDPQRTARSFGSQWNLVAPDEHGMLDVVRKGNGEPFVYQLPVTHADNAAAAEKRAAEGMAKARREQQARREARSDFSEVGTPIS